MMPIHTHGSNRKSGNDMVIARTERQEQEHYTSILVVRWLVASLAA